MVFRLLSSLIRKSKSSLKEMGFVGVLFHHLPNLLHLGLLKSIGKSILIAQFKVVVRVFT